MKQLQDKKIDALVRRMPVVILAGGRGTRLMEETQAIPKPMVTIGGKPILLHIMLYYSAFGFRRFIICLGYKGHIIKEFFLDLNRHISTLSIHTKGARHAYLARAATDWEITLAETGENSMTGQRLQRVAEFIHAPHFCLTYGDGVSDIDLRQELCTHLAHGKLGTVAAVHPPSRFGMLQLNDEGRVLVFQEKEKLRHDYINGGYFIFRREFLPRLLKNANESLESEPLASLAADGELYAYQHEHFWMCMDTLRDRELLEGLFEKGEAPWVRT